MRALVQHQFGDPAEVLAVEEVEGVGVGGGGGPGARVRGAAAAARTRALLTRR